MTPAPAIFAPVAVIETLEDRLQLPFWPSATRYRIALTTALALAAALRCARLMSLFPVLIDEAIYLRWAEIIQHRHIWFISLLDAKPPLAYWIYAAVRVLPVDPLLASRLVSVAAGVACVAVLYRIGFLCAGPVAGAVTALLYSVLPFGVFYDRLAYIDSLVNLCGALLIWAALSCFGPANLSWCRTLRLGLVLGLALFTKTTILLFALTPVAVAFYVRRSRLSLPIAHLSAAYGVAALFPVFTLFAVPAGPAFDVNNLLFHHTNFFTPWSDLLRDPLLNIRTNGPLFAGYAERYISWPALLAAALAASLCRRGLASVILVTSLLPFLFAAAALEYFPSRYVFPGAWPVLLVIGSAAALPNRSRVTRAAAVCGAVVAFSGMALQSAQILRAPERALHERDADEFTGPGPYSGSGVRDAIGLLRREAANRPMTILTDPWWGPPADAVFAYLNEVDGIKVYEAWWLQLEKKYPLVPTGRMPVWESQYRRVMAGEIDFSSLAPLYYITDTNYRTPEEVRALSPAARQIGRFPKYGGEYFIDVYRLR